MPAAIFFWILMLFWLVGLGYSWPADTTGRGWIPWGGNIILFLLLLLLGWHVFGSPIKI